MRKEKIEEYREGGRGKDGGGEIRVVGRRREDRGG